MVKGSGWRFFAGTVLGLAGLMRILDSIWAFRYDGALPEGFEDALFGGNLATYGWFYLIIGIILIGCSFGVLSGSQFSRWVGVFAGGLMAMSAILWLPFYPVWALVYIGIGIMVMYGLCVYGGRDDFLEDEGLAEAQAAAISRQM